MVLIMPESASSERKQAMAAYGAKLIEVSKEGGMEEARDLAEAMIARGEGKPLDQFSNPDNPLAHYRTTALELWEQTGGTITHFVSSMGTTGTIMGVSQRLKEYNPEVEIVGLQPEDGASIAGIRRWPQAYLPGIFDASRVDKVLDIGQYEAEEHMRRLAREEAFLPASPREVPWPARCVSPRRSRMRDRLYRLRSRGSLPVHRLVRPGDLR